MTSAASPKQRAEALKMWLKEKELAPADLVVSSGKVKISRSYITKLLQGRTKSPGADKLCLIAHKLGITVEDIVAGVTPDMYDAAGRREFDPTRLATFDAVKDILSGIDLALQTAQNEIGVAAEPTTHECNIELVNLSDILLHEEPAHDYRKILDTTDVLGVVAVLSRLDDRTYLQLDGVNQLCALAHKGYASVVAQVVDYDNRFAVGLDTWAHIIRHKAAAAFVKDANDDDQSRIRKLGSLEDASSFLIDSSSVAVVILSDTGSKKLRFIGVQTVGGNSLIAESGPVSLLQKLASHVLDTPDWEAPINMGAVETAAASLAREGRPAAAVVFRRVDRSAIQALSLHVRETPHTYSPDSGSGLLPNGVTRFIMKTGRATGLDVPLQLLREQYSDAHTREGALREILGGRSPRRRHGEPRWDYTRK